MGGFVRWLLKTFAPYAIGIGIGVGFFFLLLRIIPGPVGAGGSMAEALTSGGPQTTAAVPAVIQPVVPAPPVAAAPAPAPPQQTAQPVQKTPPAIKRQPEPPPPVQAVAPAPVVQPPVSAPVTETVPQPRIEAARPVQQPEPAFEAAADPADCGQPPHYQGVEMNRYMSCMWRQNCLSRLARSLEMVERGRSRCPVSGSQAQACQEYYDAMARRYHPAMCEQGSGGYGSNW